MGGWEGGGLALSIDSVPFCVSFLVGVWLACLRVFFFYSLCLFLWGSCLLA